MSKRDTMLIVMVIILLFTGLLVTTIYYENIEQENEFLKKENHMLKTTLDDFEAKIGELSNTVERLMKDLNRGEEWNEETFR